MLEDWVARFGDDWVSFAGGLSLGALFGAVAQRSRFCLRAATIDFWRGSLTARVAVWALAFSAAVVATQLMMRAGLLETASIRQLNQRGSLSGALIGGAMFGVGMVLTRGCASRLLVLSANGNLRALLSGLIFAVAAQAASRGLLAPARDSLAALWTIEGADRLHLLTLAGGTGALALPLALVFMTAAIAIAAHVRISWRQAAWAAGVGLMVAATWAFTAQFAATSFEPQPIKSLSFTGPSANMLMLVLQPGGRFDFDIGLVPGVFLGSFLAAAASRELKLEGFHGGESMRRYIVGAVLMGFGGMLAAGCAIGAGVSGAAVFSTVSWATLLAMWAAAGLTDALIDRAPAAAPAPTPA